MSGRFDYVKYDADSLLKQSFFKASFEALEENIEKNIPNGRAKALVLTKIEEAYMWIGKAIRDEQIIKNGTFELQEERNNE